MRKLIEWFATGYNPRNLANYPAVTAQRTGAVIAQHCTDTVQTLAQ